MSVYLCRWSNGDLSFVDASCREEAVEALDEVANAEGCQLFLFDQFMVHFALTDDGGFEFEGFGEETDNQIWDRYPVLEKAFESLYESDPSFERRELANPEHTALIRDAVNKERERVKYREAKNPETLLGQDIKRQMDAPSSMIDREVKKVANKRLNRFKPEGKPS
jgi:hypothetical protein